MRQILTPSLYRVYLLCLVAMLMAIRPAHAASDEANPGPQIKYIEMQPSFVLNFGEAGPKLRYVKADISLRVDTLPAIGAVQAHMPALRNEIVLLMSRQSEEAMMDNAKREALRLEALAKLQEIMKAEEGDTMITDLLFTNFVVQR